MCLSTARLHIESSKRCCSHECLTQSSLSTPHLVSCTPSHQCCVHPASRRPLVGVLPGANCCSPRYMRLCARLDVCHDTHDLDGGVFRYIAPGARSARSPMTLLLPLCCFLRPRHLQRRLVPLSTTGSIFHIKISGALCQAA
jgi:hypothetical protein